MPKRIDLSATASESVRRLNPAIFGQSPENAQKRTQKRESPKAHINTGQAPKSRLNGGKTGFLAKSGCGIVRQKRMNKTETRAMQWLIFQGYEHIIAQPTRLFPLAGGGTYTPDFLAWNSSDSIILVIETKGGYRGAGWEQGYDRYKRAAAQYDGGPLRFVMLTWSAKRREWSGEFWR